MKFRTLALVAAMMTMSSSYALAAWDADAIAKQYIDQGYTRVEVKVGVTQAKVEAIKGDTKIEVVYDLATGEIVKSETETVEAGEDLGPGVFIRTEEDDLSDDDDDDDVEDDEGDGDGGDDDNEDDDSGDDDDSDDDSGGDDDAGEDDDSNS